MRSKFDEQEVIDLDKEEEEEENKNDENVNNMMMMMPPPPPPPINNKNVNIDVSKIVITNEMCNHLLSAAIERYRVKAELRPKVCVICILRHGRSVEEAQRCAPNHDPGEHVDEFFFQCNMGDCCHYFGNKCYQRITRREAITFANCGTTTCLYCASHANINDLLTKKGIPLKKAGDVYVIDIKKK